MNWRTGWMALLGLALIVGCVSRTKLTEDHAAGCITQTFAYLELKRGLRGEIRTITNTEKDEIFVHVIQESPAGRGERLGTFRVQESRRIDVWDAEKENWRTVGMCD